MSINLACHAETAACIIFYGENPNPIDLIRNVKCPIMGLYGGEDDGISSNLDKLVAALIKCTKTGFEIKVYPGAPHAFFDDTNRTTCREEAAKDAWKRTLEFVGRTLGS